MWGGKELVAQLIWVNFFYRGEKGGGSKLVLIKVKGGNAVYCRHPAEERGGGVALHHLNWEKKIRP